MFCWPEGQRSGRIFFESSSVRQDCCWFFYLFDFLVVEETIDSLFTPVSLLVTGVFNLSVHLFTSLSVKWSRLLGLFLGHDPILLGFDIDYLTISELHLFILSMFEVPMGQYPPGSVKTIKMKILETGQECLL